MSAETENDFEKELIAAFLQEAREWLQQTHVALDELQQDPAPDRRVKLVQTIKAGLANLGGSAATVNLDEIAQATFSAIPFIEPLHDPAVRLSPNDFVSFCKQLGVVQAALARQEASAGENGRSPGTMRANDLLRALHELRSHQITRGTFHRNVFQTAITQVERSVGQDGVYNVEALRQWLDRSGTSEDKFLEAAQQRLPAVIDELKRLKHEGTGAPSSQERLQTVVAQVAQLWSTAQQVHASQAMTLFMGVHSFLTLLLQRRVVVTPVRFEAVEARLADSIGMIQTWVETGRTERSAVYSLLPT
jgi:chemotaxis protein histidine kinase CheA